ncbi:MAG: hypothetical protein ACLVJH_19455 [Faecalibacterium prausnitzii]
MEKIKLEIAGIPAVLYGKRSRRVYLYVHGKTAAQPRLPALPAQLARQAGRYWLSICRSTAPGKQPGKAGAVGGHPGAAGGLRPDASGMEAYPGVWGQHRGVVCYAGVADAKTGEGAACLPGGGYGKADPCPDAAGRGNGGAAARGREIPTDFGETLSWPYLCWVREHPLHWKVPTQVLYADTDPLTGHTAMEQFRQQTRAHLTILEGGEHWFHTETQLAALQSWESCHL